MSPLIDDPAVPDLADLIDAVGELIPAILNVDHGLMVAPVAAVHISDAQLLLRSASIARR